jgi:DNA helicase-2/ATP-dependent DNA helicase PcrA
MPRRPFNPPREHGRRGPPPPMLEGVPYAAEARPGPAEPFEPGERVFHQKFGPGTITAIDHDKLTVAFDHAGEKRVMQGFVGRA